MKAFDLSESVSSFVDYFECHFQLRCTRTVIGLNRLSNLIFLTYPSFILCTKHHRAYLAALYIRSFCGLLSNSNHWKLSFRA